MKKRFLLSLLGIFILPATSFALQTNIGENLNITSPINGDYYVIGNTINLNTTINGDLNTVGGKLYINSTIKEDLLAAGGDIIINGNIGETAKITAGTININSNINKDILAAGGDIIISKSTDIKGDAILAAGKIDFEGTANNANINADKVTLAGTINQNATIRAKNIVVVTGAQILGNLYYESESKNQSLENISKGTVTFKQINIQKGQEIFGILIGSYAIFRILFLLVFGFFFYYIGYKRFKKPSQELESNPLSSLGYGFLVYAAVPFLAILLMISIIGLPFGIFLGFTYIFLFVFYKLFNVVFYTNFLIEKLGGFDKISSLKKIGILLICVLFSGIFSGIDIIFTFFGLGAVIKAYIVKNKA